jgi:16S rRNA (guanine527-N7)-methyltransferase
MTFDEVNACLPGCAQLTVDKYNLLSLYLDELLQWNKKINLTAIKDKKLCWQKHIIDSLMLGEFIDEKKNLLDVGSGAGLPSIPLKVVFPELKITSVDTVGKKIQFQKHCVRKFDLNAFVPLSLRIEELKEKTPDPFDQVTSRAFSSLLQFCQLCSQYVTVGGKLIAMKGADYQREIDEAEPILPQLGLTVIRVDTRELLPGKEMRAFVTIERKV